MHFYNEELAHLVEMLKDESDECHSKTIKQIFEAFKLEMPEIEIDKKKEESSCVII